MQAAQIHRSAITTPISVVKDDSELPSTGLFVYNSSFTVQAPCALPGQICMDSVARGSLSGLTPVMSGANESVFH
jgi:hypothetical protein